MKTEQTKHKITDYLDQSKITWKEAPQEKRENLDFLITVGEKNQTAIYPSPKHPNRIVLEQFVKLGDQHREITKDMPPVDWNKFLMTIADKAVTYDVECAFDFEKENMKQLNHVKFYKFMYFDEVTIDRFFHELIRIEQVRDIMFNLVSLSMGLVTPKTSSKTPESLYR